MDFIALGILLGLLIFSVIMFIIIRSQSKKSEHPEAQNPNYADPTPLYHAPEGSQAEFSRSMLSLSLAKNGTAGGSVLEVEHAGSGSTLGGPGRVKGVGREGEPRKERLFFEDVGMGSVRDSRMLAGRNEVV